MARNPRIGVENLTLAKMLTDTDAGTTYDTPFSISKKLIKVGFKGSPSADKLFADDEVVDVIVDDGDIAIEINVTDLTEDEKATIFGNTMAAGVRSPGNDERPYWSVSWKSKKRSGAYKYYKALKVIFYEPDEEFETKGEKIVPQTDTITGIGIKRISDGLRKRVADSESSTWDSATGTAWFASGDISPDTTPPTVTVEPEDNDIGVAVNSDIVWTFSEAILASQVTGDPDETNPYFTLMTAAGVVVAGTLSIDSEHKVVTFNPTENLAAGTEYIAMCKGVKDLSGNALAAASIVNFTTAS